MKSRKFCQTAVLSALLFFASTGFAVAGWLPNIKVVGLVVSSDGTVNFDIVGEAVGTCYFWNTRFTFDAKTVGGRNMLATLLAARTTDKAVNVSYADSTAPQGSDNTNGCTALNMARVWAVTI